MKNTVLIVCFFAFCTSLFAQNPRIKTFGDRRTETYTYRNGGDSVRFSIIGDTDTLQSDFFYQNGNIAACYWKKDSAFVFNEFGVLFSKSFGFYNASNTADSTIQFYVNGQRKSVTVEKKHLIFNKLYREDGALHTAKSDIQASLTYLIRLEDGNGVPIKVTQIDTITQSGEIFTIEKDTIFYENGKPFRIKKSNWEESYATNYYKKDGTLMYSTIPDSALLIPIKDNIDCYYGLRNKQGDTIVKPRFDRIDKLNHDFWAAYSGESLILLDMKGAPITPPSNQMSKIYQIIEAFSPVIENNQIEGMESRQDYLQDSPTSTWYVFEEGKKYGVIDNKAQLILTPQYFPISSQSHNGRFFFSVEHWKDSLAKIVYLNRKGNLIFQEKFKWIAPSKFEDYFFLRTKKNYTYNTFEQRQMLRQLTVGTAPELSNDLGLGKAENQIVLPTKFNNIEHVPNTTLFVTSILKVNKKGQKYYYQNGVFDVRKKRWLLDSAHFAIHNNAGLGGTSFFIIQKLSTQKYGIMDTSGIYLLPIEYDSIGVNALQKVFIWVKKGNKYQIVDIKNGKATIHKDTYDFLETISMSSWSNLSKKHTYFIAKRENKWGVVNAHDSIIKAFDFDYAAKSKEEGLFFILVKNNQATSYALSSLPNHDNNLFYFDRSNSFSFEKNKGIKSYSPINDPEHAFFINETGKVVIPPQYKRLYSNDFVSNYTLVEDSQKHKKLIFLDSIQIVDYPFNYDIVDAKSKSKVIIVRDSSAKPDMNNGVVSKDGKILVPCVNYDIALSDMDQSVFFVKRDTPSNYSIIQRMNTNSLINSDSLDEIDNSWLMYDENGKQLNEKPFRYAVDFKKGIGIGTQEDVANLYKADGSILTPFHKNTEGVKIVRETTTQLPKGFNNIRQDPITNFYSLFYNQGLTPTLILTKDDGEIIVKGGRYDGISEFYGKYALVTAARKVGLIDSFGREIIEPQDLRTYQEQLLDSLNIANLPYSGSPKNGLAYNPNNKRLPLDFNTVDPDSLKISSKQRKIFVNLLLEKSLYKTIITASDFSIRRAPSLQYPKGLVDNAWKETNYMPLRAKVADKTISFALVKQRSFTNSQRLFYNFYFQNSRWEDLKINDLLQIQGEKRWEMNELITKRVRALKDQQIDCSNASAFIATVENRWMLTKEGIDFCFDSTGGGSDFVIVSFTWAELAPFLKMKIF